MNVDHIDMGFTRVGIQLNGRQLVLHVRREQKNRSMIRSVISSKVASDFFERFVRVQLTYSQSAFRDTVTFKKKMGLGF
jgi:hypothetical protein